MSPSRWLPRRFPRRVPLEPRFAQLLPEVLLGLGPAEFARLASLTLTPKPPPKVDTDHIHNPAISIREQVQVIATLLRKLGRASFRRLTANAAGSYEEVASFLALLELYREEAVSFDQVAPLVPALRLVRVCGVAWGPLARRSWLRHLPILAAQLPERVSRRVTGAEPSRSAPSGRTGRVQRRPAGASAIMVLVA